MSKKNPRNTGNRSRFAVEIRSIDDLAIMSDEELSMRSQEMTDAVRNRHLTPMSAEAAAWEAEVAYVQREQEIRQLRKVAHRRYLDQLRAEEVDENTLPEYQGNPPNWN